MLKIRGYIAGGVLLSLLLLVGCGEYEQILKSRDYEMKLAKGMEYYEAEEYVKASTIFDQVVNIYRGTLKADTVKFYQAKSYYAMRDYTLAGHYFQELANIFANSNYLEEAEFMVAYCHYKMSPRAELDQTSTMQAINSLKMYMSKYPTSERLNECNELVLELGDKIVEKSFISARLYYDLGYYKSAIIALRNSLKEYPDTKHREELMYYVLRSTYLLADNSIESKRMDRFQNTVDEYLSFSSEFPESENIKDAERMYNNSEKVLATYKKNE